MFNIILLGIVSLLTDISSEMVYPLLPLYLVTTLGASPAMLGFIEGVAESIASILKVFSGYFSDKAKRRKPLTIIGYSYSVIGKILLFLSYSWSFVFSARIIDRIGKGIRTAPRDALISENADSSKMGSAFGLHRAMDTLGAVVGIVLAYYFFAKYSGDYKKVFFFAVIPAIIAIGVLFFVKERRRDKDSLLKSDAKINIFREFKNLNPKLKNFLVVTTFFALGNSSNQFLILRAKDLGYGVASAILLYLVYNIVYFVSVWPLTKLSDYIGRKKVLIAGYLSYGLIYLGFAFTKNPAFLWVLFGLYGLYMGFSEGVEKTLVSDFSSSTIRATAIGTHAALVGIGLFPASFIAGISWAKFGAPAPFIFGGAMALISAILLWRLI